MRHKKDVENFIKMVRKIFPNLNESRLDISIENVQKMLKKTGLGNRFKKALRLKKMTSQDIVKGGFLNELRTLVFTISVYKDDETSDKLEESLREFEKRRNKEV